MEGVFVSKSERKIVLGMPGYGKQTAGAGRGFWLACENMTFAGSKQHHLIEENDELREKAGLPKADRPPMTTVWNAYQCGSLLAANFNQLWCLALNLVHRGEKIDYFAMLHDDITPEPYWLDKLIDELEAKQLDMLSVVVPIKDIRGMTSTGLCREPDDQLYHWAPWAKLSMHDVHQLPETFTAEDAGRPLLLNTGCWVIKWNQDVCRRLHFEINDQIRFNTQLGQYQSFTEPEDWNFSRQCHELGLRIGATRKIRVEHRGETDFTNAYPWGKDSFDRELMTRSPIPGAFPHDIKGWLSVEEGAALADLARGKRVLEIGSYHGRSTVCMARTAEHVTAVDFWDSPEVEFYGDYEAEFDKSILRHGVKDKVTKRRPGDELDGEYDFAFIDGAHDYESVTRDTEKALAVLVPGSLIAFHDYRGGIDPGVDKAVDELVAAGGELVSLTKTLAVVRPPAEIPLEV